MDLSTQPVTAELLTSLQAVAAPPERGAIAMPPPATTQADISAAGQSLLASDGRCSCGAGGGCNCASGGAPVLTYSR
ncbi:hypothetical protein GCM10025771_24470 [Niveibacterium umoris]|uniref:Uncharacterized protein n=1 Tax=Niveibacterium umoris TaxID=1193620 RepID=A0A840BJ40_9RHOO|nr:hypothetical protein [Niveibacterium umoris]MBB4012364.1 hypothetical protein [Niveibacterium umoris]